MKTQYQHKSHKGFTLIEMLGVLAIIAILISVIAVGVLAAINRARVIATISNFKNLETAVVGFVANASSGGTVPLTGAVATEGVAVYTAAVGGATPSPAAVTHNTVGTGYTLDQVLRASGGIDRPMSWRIGKDSAAEIAFGEEPTFLLSKNAFAVAGTLLNNVAAKGPNVLWVGYNRTEAVVVKTVATTGDITDYITLTDDDVTAANFLIDGQTPLSASRVALVVLKNVSVKDANKLSQELNANLDDSEINPLVQLRGRFIYEATNTATPVDCYYYLASF